METPVNVESENENCYVVEKILLCKATKGVQYYHVKWEGWPSSANTWESVDSFENSQKLLEEFHERNGDHPRTRRWRRRT
jgi:hypothetical protein